MNRKPILPNRFILRVICNRCGINAPTGLGIQGSKLVMSCLNCGEAETYDLEPKESEEALGIEEQAYIKKLLNEKNKEKVIS